MMGIVGARQLDLCGLGAGRRGRCRPKPSGLAGGGDQLSKPVADAALPWLYVA